jgi:hypothetical protein
MRENAGLELIGHHLRNGKRFCGAGHDFGNTGAIGGIDGLPARKKVGRIAGVMFGGHCFSSY